MARNLNNKSCNMIQPIKLMQKKKSSTTRCRHRDWVELQRIKWNAIVVAWWLEGIRWKWDASNCCGLLGVKDVQNYTIVAYWDLDSSIIVGAALRGSIGLKDLIICYLDLAFIYCYYDLVVIFSVIFLLLGWVYCLFKYCYLLIMAAM